MTLQGMSLSRARAFLSRSILPLIGGIYRDDYWLGPKKVFDFLRESDIDYGIVSAEYRHDESGIPCSKVWKVDLPFVDNKGKERLIRGTLTAHGAGSVRDPLDAYDLTMSIY